MSICSTNNQKEFMNMLDKMQQDPNQKAYATPNVDQQEEYEYLELNEHIKKTITNVFHDKNVNFIIDKINDIIKTAIEPKLQEFINTIVEANNIKLGQEYAGFVYKENSYLNNNTTHTHVIDLDPEVEKEHINLLDFIVNYNNDMKNITSYLHTLYNAVTKVNMMVGLLPEYYQVSIEHHITNIPPVDFIFECYPTLKKDLWEDLINNKLTFYTAYAKIN
jgi:superoxide dismutase